MSMVLTKQPNWKAVLNGKARLVHQQIASLQRWVEDAGGGKKMLDELSAPYYDLLQSIYEEDFPLASSKGRGPVSAVKNAPLHRGVAVRGNTSKLAGNVSRSKYEVKKIRIPVQMTETIKRVMLVQKQLVKKFGRKTTPEEVAEEMCMPVERIRALLRLAETADPVALALGVQG